MGGGSGSSGKDAVLPLKKNLKSVPPRPEVGVAKFGSVKTAQDLGFAALMIPNVPLYFGSEGGVSGSARKSFFCRTFEVG